MAGGSKSGIFAFDQFKLDSGKLMLYRDGVEVSIPPKVARTLAVLVESAGTIISKEEIIERVWSDSIVEESNLTQYLYLLRKILGNMGDGRPYIETLRRRGYRFNGRVEQIPEVAPSVKTAIRPQPEADQPVPETHPVFGGVERQGNVLRVIDWRSPEPAKEEPAAVVNPANAPPRGSDTTRHSQFAVAAVALLAVMALAIYFLPRMPAAINAEPERELSVTRLTNGAFPSGGTISPDGNVIAYHEVDGDIVRIFAQQTGEASRIELLATSQLSINGLTFSPDGKFVYFVATDKSGGPGSVHRLPAMGGPSIKVLGNADNTVSFSPDGSEITFRRSDLGGQATSLMISDRDGKAERVLLQRRTPKTLTAPSWSPDGKLILFGEMDLGTGKSTGRCRLYVVEVATGRVTPVSDEKWDNILRAQWFPDGAGFAVVATRENEGYSTRRDQVYYVSFPGGVSRRITTDGNRHEPNSLGVTRDGAVFAISGNRSSQLWTMNANGDASTARQITRGVADGRAGLGPLPDGGIGYLARVADDINIMLSNGDGLETKQLATGFPFVEELRADPLGRFFVFSSAKDAKNQLFRINSDGTGVRQLTFGNEGVIDSTISPDGKWIIYDSVAAQVVSLWRIPAEGGQAVMLATKGCAIPVYSPDGSMISCVLVDKHEIVILSAADGVEIERHPRPAFATWNFGIGWTPDGTGLVYIVTEKNASNLWIQPRDGGKPQQLTNFSSGIIYRYAFAPDGSKLYLARGYPLQDAILIRNLR